MIWAMRGSMGRKQISLMFERFAAVLFCMCVFIAGSLEIPHEKDVRPFQMQILACLTWSYNLCTIEVIEQDS